MSGKVFQLFLMLLNWMAVYARPIIQKGCGGDGKQGQHCPCYMPLISALLGSVINMTLGSCVGYLITRALRRYLGKIGERKGHPKSTLRTRKRGWTRLAWRRNR